MKAQPCEVPARVCEALDEPLTYRVAGDRHDDGDRRGRLLERAQRRPGGDNHIHLETDQLGGQTGEALRPALAPARFGHEMLSVHVAELAQSVQERVQTRGGPGLGPDQVGCRATTAEDPDPIDLARGLGGGDARHREGPEGEAADEGPPIHQWITSSDRGSSDADGVGRNTLALPSHR